jgi:lysozyme family protein
MSLHEPHVATVSSGKFAFVYLVGLGHPHEDILDFTGQSFSCGASLKMRAHSTTRPSSQPPFGWGRPARTWR